MDKTWFYAKSGTTQREGPISESEIRTLIQSSALSPTDLVWCEGMQTWTQITFVEDFKSVPILAVAHAKEDAAANAVPVGLVGWMKFIGIVNVVFGVINCLSCFGVITGVFMILAGIALIKAKQLLGLVTAVPHTLMPFFEKLRTYMIMTGIMYIIGVIVGIVVMVIYFGVFAAAFAGAFGQR